MNKSENNSYYLVSKHHANYTDWDIENRKDEGPKIWIRPGTFSDISLCFELDGARTLRDTLDTAIKVVEQQSVEALAGKP